MEMTANLLTSFSTPGTPARLARSDTGSFRINFSSTRSWEMNGSATDGILLIKSCLECKILTRSLVGSPATMLTKAGLKVSKFTISWSESEERISCNLDDDRLVKKEIGSIPMVQGLVLAIWTMEETGIIPNKSGNMFATIRRLSSDIRDKSS